MSATTDGREVRQFETAQRGLFETYGLDVGSRLVTIETTGTRIRVHDTGGPGGDTPLVFVHGTAGFGAFFAPLMGQFQERRLVAFDRPGYGSSDPFRYTTADLQPTLVGVLEGLIDELGAERIDLVGHSMGGHAGIRFALARPERVRRLVLVGAVPAFPGTRPPVALRLLTVPGVGRVLRRLQPSGEAGVLEIADRFGERETITLHPALIEALAAHEEVPTAADAGFSEFKALFSLRGWDPSVRLRARHLRELEPPTTVIWGDHDPLGGPDAVRNGVALIPDARFRTLDAGHIPFLAHAERCARLIRAP